MPCLSRLSRPYGRSCCTSLTFLLPMCFSLRWEGSGASQIGGSQDRHRGQIARAARASLLGVTASSTARSAGDRHSSRCRSAARSCARPYARPGRAVTAPVAQGASPASRRAGRMVDRIADDRHAVVGRRAERVGLPGNGAETAHRPTARWVCLSPWRGP
jgi:hypothetical protein